MKRFADLLTTLIFAPGRNEKLRRLQRYFAQTPDPDRGWALAAFAGEISLPSATPAMLRALVEARVDPVLFRYSYDYVGDLAETVALIWPSSSCCEPKDAPRLRDVIDKLLTLSRTNAPPILADLLDHMPPDQRLALVKLTTGGLRVGVSARIAKTALSEWAASRAVNAPLERIEELWHGLEPPYEPLFAWLSGAAPEPDVDLATSFRPMMLANAIDGALYGADELRADQIAAPETIVRLQQRLDPAEFAAEWKWDGVRVQAISVNGVRRLFSRSGDDIAAAFPDLVDALEFEGVLDGELLVVRDGVVAPFAEVQKRLGRKKAGPKLLRESPAFLRAYDLLRAGSHDMRGEPFRVRREALEMFVQGADGGRIDVSPLIAFDSWAELATLRADATTDKEGVMLKRWDGVYVGGRPMGQWWKWKRDPLTADCVLLYAQRGHGGRSSYFSDYTFGVWRRAADGTRELAPVGKAYSGFTDQELTRLDQWVRANTVERYGPVRAVKPALVVEVAFDSIQPSPRRKAGVAMRFPRFKRIRWDKPAQEADQIEQLKALIGARPEQGA
ncbi:MAG: cisplatin damage response ATP-dependent DNA ligase [Neomegalonema sp.]|nr:cisplatin damage response ATP-dependent DNA ligase [Neomegalonema sp.]